MITVGLTGGIGSGKSTVAKMFKKLNVPVYVSDKEAKKLMRSSKKIKKELISLFGVEAFKDEKLNKTLISDIVFKDREMLKKLNKIVHPAVRKHFKAWSAKQKAPYVVQEAAIIFENGTHDFYDRIILVTAPQESRIQRVMKRDNVPIENVVARIKNQWPDSKKIQMADYVIENSNLAETHQKVKAIHNALLDYC
ncbi:dephospho-CoA kinase [Costertonia aggregata]|uniref:Dephospho-CoA kinase n=1 Tax=Costertonia aggregata TaxID=343403 RepID=A0A7H9AJR9_9FLAO|nr:dephospho-CoA kinase [Costertonia aggregata]QLG43842.1 dephospho-CoA kinase [Costertonia aggregata]